MHILIRSNVNHSLFYLPTFQETAILQTKIHSKLMLVHCKFTVHFLVQIFLLFSTHFDFLFETVVLNRTLTFGEVMD